MANMSLTENRKRESQIFLSKRREQLLLFLCLNLIRIRSKENDHHLQKRRQDLPQYEVVLI